MPFPYLFLSEPTTTNPVLPPKGGMKKPKPPIQPLLGLPGAEVENVAGPKPTSEIPAMRTPPGMRSPALTPAPAVEAAAAATSTGKAQPAPAFPSATPAVPAKPASRPIPTSPQPSQPAAAPDAAPAPLAQTVPMTEATPPARPQQQQALSAEPAPRQPVSPQQAQPPSPHGALSAAPASVSASTPAAGQAAAGANGQTAAVAEAAGRQMPGALGGTARSGSMAAGNMASNPEGLALAENPTTISGGSLIPPSGPGGQPKGTDAEAQALQVAGEQALAGVGTDATPEARAAALAQAGLSPAGIHKKINEGRISHEQGLQLNEKLHGIKEVNATSLGSQQELGEWVAQPGNAKGEWFRNGSPQQKAVAINEFYDDLAKRSAGNLFATPERIDELRREALGTVDARWKVPGSVSPGSAPKDGPAGFESIPMKEGGSTLLPSGRWTVEDVERMHENPAFTKATQVERDAVMNDILGKSFADFRSRPGFDQAAYQRFTDIAQQAREKSSALKTWGETGQNALSFGSNLLTGIVRPIIAAATDLSVKDPDGEWRVPLGNVAEQAYYWGEKAVDLKERYDSQSYPARSRLTSELDALYHDLTQGNFPLNDRAKLDEWMAARSQQITGAQKGWYEAVQGKADTTTDKGVFQHAYTHANSLLNPRNAGLMAKFMETRDPAVWKELSGHLMQTPQRAQTDAAQAKSLEESKMVRFMSENYEGGDYAEHMIAAGDPIEIASNVIPVIRGLRSGKAAVEAGIKAGKVGLKATAGALTKSAAIDLGIGGVQTFIDNPEATFGDLMEAGKENIATALGLHTAGHVYAKGKALVTGGGKPAAAPGTGQGGAARVDQAPSPPPAPTGAGDGSGGSATATPSTPGTGGGSQAARRGPGADGETPQANAGQAIPDPTTIGSSGTSVRTQGTPSRPPLSVPDSGKLIHNVMNRPPEQRSHRTTQADLAQARQVVEDRVRELEGQPGPLSEAQQKELAGAKKALDRLEPEGSSSSTSSSSGSLSPGSTASTNAGTSPTGHVTGTYSGPGDSSSTSSSSTDGGGGSNTGARGSHTTDGVTPVGGAPHTGTTDSAAPVNGRDMGPGEGGVNSRSDPSAPPLLGGERHGTLTPGSRNTGNSQDLVLAGGGPDSMTGGAEAEVPTMQAGNTMSGAIGSTITGEGAVNPDAPAASAGGTPPPNRPAEEGTTDHSSIRILPDTSSIKSSTPSGNGAGRSSSLGHAPSADIPDGDILPPQVFRGPELSFPPSLKMEWNVPFAPDRHLPPDKPFDAARTPSKPPKTLSKGDVDKGNIRGCEGENEATAVLTQNGYDYDQVTQNKKKRPDGSFEGRADGIFGGAPNSKSDTYSPAARTKIKAIHDTVVGKVDRQKSPYVVIRL